MKARRRYDGYNMDELNKAIEHCVRSNPARRGRAPQSQHDSGLSELRPQQASQPKRGNGAKKELKKAVLR